MTKALALTDCELAEVRAILGTHLPPQVRAAVFGSRAGGQPKPWSDLDIVLEGPDLLPIDLLAEIAEAFDESDLPWKVDIVDRRTVSDTFGAIIDTTQVAISR